MHSVNQTALGESRWEILFAATSASSCGCKAGTQPDGQVDINYVDGGPPEDALEGRGHGCVVCGEGLECLGMGQLRIAAGKVKRKFGADKEPVAERQPPLELFSKD
eukprot:5436749-Amphidinium_carterae.1